MTMAATTAPHQLHRPVRHLPTPAIRAVAAGTSTVTERDPFQRDPAMVARVFPLIELVNLYFGTEVRGWSHLPARGPFLIVGNHSGGAQTQDLLFLLGKWIQERGAAAPLYALGYDLLFSYPIVGPLLPKLGLIPANRANARRALRMGAPVVVFPGGDYEVFRPWSERNCIAFGGHTGFIELAITARVPVVPMTIHGAHQSTLTLTRGWQLARMMGIDRLHIGVFPLIWNIPFGPTPAFIPSLQLPAKVTLQIGAPLDWSCYSARQAHDPAVLRRCYTQITQRMQRTLDELAHERPYPVLSRLTDLRPSRMLGALPFDGAGGRTSSQLPSKQAGRHPNVFLLGKKKATVLRGGRRATAGPRRDRTQRGAHATT